MTTSELCPKKVMVLGVVEDGVVTCYRCCDGGGVNTITVILGDACSQCGGISAYIANIGWFYKNGIEAMTEAIND